MTRLGWTSLIALAVLALIGAGWLWYRPMPVPAPHLAQHVPQRGANWDDDWDDRAEEEPIPAPTFDVLPLKDVLRRVARRYDGRVLTVDISAPNDNEEDLGVQLVYDIRLLGPEGDVVRVRMDARDGRFLEVAGRDLERLRKNTKKDDD